MDERQLIKGCLNKELRSQKALYDAMHPKMLGVCMRYARDRDEAQDMLQEGFIKVFQNIASFKGEGSFEGWIRRIMVNASLEHLRREKKNRGEAAFERESLMVVDKNESAQDAMQAEDVLKYIQQLSPGYRMVFNLFAIEGYSHDEIATKLQISVNTSYSQYHRAKAILQRLLSNEKKTSIKAAI